MGQDFVKSEDERCRDGEGGQCGVSVAIAYAATTTDACLAVDTQFWFTSGRMSPSPPPASSLDADLARYDPLRAVALRVVHGERHHLAAARWMHPDRVSPGPLLTFPPRPVRGTAAGTPLPPAASRQSRWR